MFFAAGFLFASWASRIPQVRAELRLSPGALGLILLCGSAGAVAGTTLAGPVTSRLGEARTAVLMTWAACAGLATVAVGTRLGSGVVAGGMLLSGFGTGAGDVAINVQGAAVERALGRAIMPRFHAGWSIGTVAGAGAGAVMVALGVPVTLHLLVVAALAAAAEPVAVRWFLPPAGLPEGAQAPGRSAPPGDAAVPGRAGPPRRSAFAAWTEPRTLLIGLFVLCMAFIEGTGNDWLSLAVIDGYHQPAVLGTLTFALFLAAMTAGRWWGPPFIDRYGRVPVLRVSAAAALAGLVMVGLGGSLAVAVAGAVLLGLGAALGFPVGISSAADGQQPAAARVSTAASIGYMAFLAGPPALGFAGDHLGVAHSVALASVVAAAAILLARATAPPTQATGPPRQAAAPPAPATGPPGGATARACEGTAPPSQATAAPGEPAPQGRATGPMGDLASGP